MMIAFENIDKRISKGFTVRIPDLAVAEGETLVLFGPSGCGKTTTLRLIAGFEQPDKGILRINGQQANSRLRPLPPHRRRVSMVFQDLALWPHMTVQKHLDFVLDAGPRSRDRSQKSGMARKLLEQIGLEHKAGNYPHQLSGGEKQRLALARAFAAQPAVLLMDEPLSSLDAHLRSAMLRDIRELIHQQAITTVYVTHDWHEALFLADRIAVMDRGQVVKQLDRREARRMPSPDACVDWYSQTLKTDQAGFDGTAVEPNHNGRDGSNVNQTLIRSIG